ncbi:3-hydroxyacyl-ACP dehydratase FabZ family protein [Buchnera aphidicola]|uniref:3-hydroxyacyl-ACP dehydratase FabZ family protein n=1 Tax=Buchnera aphidicola TaxID=9 RepID=UPI0020926C0F|nr:3-hydroxyacyl-ACP dehydratase FabZ family protein [Buchnera aphidicola]USS94287.1 beta-hydroxyacyl-ACP dehydratase [Buchnera aphidicola (Sipha maydis)]WII23837.1 beta-hydroxyacyl-ACP dehydratase [Buchnera aphidicola (Sipha maydis)]
MNIFIDFLKFIPHRKPFLFVDEILCFQKNKYLFSKTHIRATDSFFLGHFPNNPIFPGIFILESMMQSAGILIGINNLNIVNSNRINYVTYIKNAKFCNIVLPNSDMYVKIFIINKKKHFIKFQGYAFVNNILVCKAIITIYVK